MEDEGTFLERIADQLQLMHPSHSGGVAATTSAVAPGPTSIPSLASRGSVGGDSLDDVSVKLAKLAKRPVSSS